jgi:hypothetical protein
LSAARGAVVKGYFAHYSRMRRRRKNCGAKNIRAAQNIRATPANGLNFSNVVSSINQPIPVRTCFRSLLSLP